MKQYIHFKVRHLSIFKYSFHYPNTECNAETKQLAKFACVPRSAHNNSIKD